MRTDQWALNPSKTLEEKIEIIVKMRVEKLPLLPACYCLHLLAKAAVTVSEATVEHRRPQDSPMPFNESLAERTRQRLARRKNVEEKRMFGGVGFLLSGNLLVCVRRGSLLVRVGPEQNDDALKEAHVSEFVIEGRGTMNGWVVVGLEGVEDDDQLKGWIQRAVNFVRTLPAKEK